MIKRREQLPMSFQSYPFEHFFAHGIEDASPSADVRFQRLFDFRDECSVWQFGLIAGMRRSSFFAAPRTTAVVEDDPEPTLGASRNCCVAAR